MLPRGCVCGYSAHRGCILSSSDGISDGTDTIRTGDIIYKLIAICGGTQSFVICLSEISDVSHSYFVPVVYCNNEIHERVNKMQMEKFSKYLYLHNDVEFEIVSSIDVQCLSQSYLIRKLY